MLNNQLRREILDTAKATGFEGSILDLYQMANQGADVPTMLQAEAQAKQENMLVAQTPQEQQVGLREQQAMGNIDASMVFPDVPANTSFNTEGMRVPINITKVDDQGHLVQSYQNVPPGIKDLPTGPKRGTVIETPAYKTGGYKDKYGTTYEEDPDVRFSTGLDDTYNISPRILKDTLKLVGNKTIPSATYSKLVGYEFFKDNVRKRGLDVQEKLQDYRPGKKELMTALNTIIPASEKLSDEEYAGLRNELLGIYDTYKDFDSISDIPAAYRAVKNQDLSALKPYREKMGLSKQQLLDLIQVPEDAGTLKRKAINFVKSEMAKKDFRKGGYRSKYGKDPVTGTGKKPKGSGRRLYTDENPKDTVGIKFATPADARATVAKVKKVNKPFARKIQILTVGEQRAKVMGKSQVSSIFTRGKEALRRGRKRT